MTSQQLMQISLDGCLPAAGKVLAGICFPPELRYVSGRGPCSAAITACSCRGSRRAKPGCPAALGGRPVMAWAAGGWGQHKAGTNPSAAVTSQGSSTTQPKVGNPTWQVISTQGWVLSSPSPPPKWPGASLRHHCAHILALALAELSSEKSCFSCVFPPDDGGKVEELPVLH